MWPIRVTPAPPSNVPTHRLSVRCPRHPGSVLTADPGLETTTRLSVPELYPRAECAGYYIGRVRAREDRALLNQADPCFVKRNSPSVNRTRAASRYCTLFLVAFHTPDFQRNVELIISSDLPAILRYETKSPRPAPGAHVQTAGFSLPADLEAGSHPLQGRFAPLVTTGDNLDPECILVLSSTRECRWPCAAASGAVLRRTRSWRW